MRTLIPFTIATQALLASVSAAEPTEQALALPTGVLQDYSFNWLASPGAVPREPNAIQVYSLACGVCQKELAAIAAGTRNGPARFVLNGLNDQSRSVTIAFLAAGLALSDPAGRQEALFDLIQLFTLEADRYLDDPDKWKALVELSIDSQSTAMPTAAAWALAHDIVDTQARILAFANKLATPSQIRLDKPVYARRVHQGSSRHQALIAAVSLSWIRPPLKTKEDAEAVLQKRLPINPTIPLSPADWSALREKASQGTYWIWTGTADEIIREDLLDWQAAYHLLPDDSSRKARFLDWIDQALAKSSRQPISPLEALGPIDLDALASPQWLLAKADARLHLEFSRYWNWLDDH